jgi:hypothetical protein
MTRGFSQHLLAGLSMGFLLLVPLQPASATIIFDDHFTGDSGGIPANWSRLFGTGAVVEAGTTVTLGQDGVGDDVAIGSDATVDPSSGTMTIQTEFTGIVGQGMSGLFAGSWPSLVGFFGCAIRLDDGRLEVTVGDAEGGSEWYDVGHLVGYTGGPIRLTMVLGPTWFSVSTDSPPFSSGPIDYTAVFSTFTREDLGSAAHALLFDYGDPGTTIVDRILVDVEGATPVESMTFGRIKALFRR